MRSLIARSFDVVGNALREAGRRPKEIDSVVLVGGSTRIPLVRRMVEEFFGRAKTMAGMRRARHAGRQEITQCLEPAAAAYNLVRMKNLMAA